MAVSDADAQRAAGTFGDVLAGRTILGRLPGMAARAAIRKDLEAAGLLAGADPFPEWDYRRICDELLPRDGDEMRNWGPAEWRPVLDMARRLAAGTNEEN